MVGNLKDAQTACDIFYSLKQLPNGWSEIGAGAQRQVYLSPDKTVYKVCLGDDWGDACEPNRIEAKVGRKLRNVKYLADKQIFIPQMRNWRVKNRFRSEEYVLASEFIEGSGRRVRCGWYYGKDCDCRNFGTTRWCFGRMLTYLEDIGFCDMFDANMIHTKDGKTYIIDLGCEGGLS